MKEGPCKQVRQQKQHVQIKNDRLGKWLYTQKTFFLENSIDQIV